MAKMRNMVGCLAASAIIALPNYAVANPIKHIGNALVNIPSTITREIGDGIKEGHAAIPVLGIAFGAIDGVCKSAVYTPLNTIERTVDLASGAGPRAYNENGGLTSSLDSTRLGRTVASGVGGLGIGYFSGLAIANSTHFQEVHAVRAGMAIGGLTGIATSQVTEASQ